MKTEAANPHPAKDAPYLPNVSFLDTRVSMTSTMRGVKTRGKASAVQQLSTKGVQRCVDPHLSGFRAAAWVAQWDRGNRATRRHVLEGFIALHSNSNISAVEADLGDGAALFFARMTSTLKLSYKTLAKEPSLGKTVLPPPTRPRHSSASTAVASPNAAETTATSLGCTSNSLNMSLPPRPSIGRRPTLHDEPQTKAPSSTNGNAAPTFLLLLIEALTVFVRGNQYLTLLVETGMAAALTDCLECGTQPQPIVQTSLFGNASPPEEMERAAAPSPYVRLSVEERKSVVLLLLFAANAGRVYREMLSDEECLVCLIHTLQRETEKDIASLLTELLILLGQGNPHTAPLIHSGLVRVILSYCAFELRRSESAVENILATPHDATVILSAVRGQEETSSPDVVVLAARALRDLQLGKEVHHYNSFYSFSDGGQEVCDNPHDQRRLNMMPVVGLGGDVNALSYEVPRLPPTASPSRILLSELNTEQFLAGICYMILHDTNIRLQVEGTEIMVLVSKNITLIRPILVRLFDVLDDDRLTIVDEDDTVAMAHCHRRQLSCGRAAVQVMLAKPMTPERRSIILDVIALRSAHMTLLKYLRIADSGEKAAVGLCCQAVQMLARASEEQQSPQTTLQSTPRGGSTSATVSASLIKMGRFIRESLGDALYQVLLHQQVTEDESFAMLRAARASASLCFRGAWGGAGSGQ